MRIETARLLAEIFSNIELRKNNQKNQLLKQVNKSKIPDADKAFLREFVRYYINLRTRLTTDLRHRAPWKILVDCLDIDRSAAKELALDTRIFIGVLGFDLFVTESGVRIINEEEAKIPRDDISSAPTPRLADDTSGLAITNSTNYPCTVICEEHLALPLAEERLIAAVFKRPTLTSTERHENMHQLFSVVSRLRGMPEPLLLRDVHSRLRRLEKLTELGAPSSILERTRTLLLQAVKAIRPEIHSLDNLTEEDWLGFYRNYQKESLDFVCVSTADEILARLYVSETKAIPGTLSNSYLPEWTRNISDFDTKSWEQVLNGALVAIDGLRLAGVPNNVAVMMLVDRDIRDWPQALTEL